jgi:UDP-N-acetylglucosamine--N-acetylmuramyl-(pentapeptide) pyrophosphoryl-undecaprenol N-acetylglucosamine transferase
MRKDIVIAGGGTAGHTNPGIAVAQALVDLGIESDAIQFVGGKRGSEGILVAAAGFNISLLPGRGVKRQISFASAMAALSLVYGAISGLFLMLKFWPKAVLCLGGYAAFPASLAAVVLRRPLIVSEQNARSSAVNRLFSKFAKKCALPFPDTDLPKGVVTGNPIRSNIVPLATAEKAATRQQYSVKPDCVFVAIWSGSLGAQSINEATKDLIKAWSDKQAVTLYHIVGRRNWSEFEDFKPHLNGLTYVAVAYEDDMASLLQAIDVAVCRSGASTISELAIGGIPSILVPLPHAPRDHQRANADELVNIGAARLIEDSELTGESLGQALDPIVNDHNLRLRMIAAAVSIAKPDAAKDVAKLLLEAGRINL